MAGFQLKVKSENMCVEILVELQVVEIRPSGVPYGLGVAVTS